MKSKALLLFFFLSLSLILSAQKTQLTGKVTDTNQNPVKGAMIFTDQNNTGKATNKQGVYKIKLDASVKTIKVVTADGRISEQLYNNESEINFTLPVNLTGSSNVATSGQQDEEVNIGYGTVNKKNVTSSVTKVDASKEQYVYKDIYEMLKGKPGVQVTGRTVRIQGGVNSLNSGTEPLYVVDGITVGSIDGILPQTVKSIEILKGSSASIYGSRGANGVILITLKK
ncbi:MAG TPA: TonB-dependent receptor plug domain-containing protein [Bacteroidales bacterium]|nr:TonB-dependent receptor plug domain-containing protein [Bacteroidales bacterium]